MADRELPAPEQKPVVVIKRNESGQIVMQTPDGNPFDMSKYIGAKLYTAPPEQKPVAYVCWSNPKNADGTLTNFRSWLSHQPEGYVYQPLRMR